MRKYKINKYNDYIGGNVFECKIWKLWEEKRIGVCERNGNKVNFWKIITKKYINFIVKGLN